MDFPTMQQEKEDFKDFFLNNETSQPLINRKQESLLENSKESTDFKGSTSKVFTTIYAIIGGYFLFVGLSVIFRYLLNPSIFSNRWSLSQQLIYPIGGLILLFLNIGKPQKKSDWLLYSFSPVLSAVFVFIFNLIPQEWIRGDAFAYSMFSIYFLIMFAFLYIRKYFKSLDE